MSEKRPPDYDFKELLAKLDDPDPAVRAAAIEWMEAEFQARRAQELGGEVATAILDGIPGAFESAQDARADAVEGRVISLEEFARRRFR